MHAFNSDKLALKKKEKKKKKLALMGFSHKKSGKIKYFKTPFQAVGN